MLRAASPSLPTTVIPGRGVVMVSSQISTFWDPGHNFGAHEARHHFKFQLVRRLNVKSTAITHVKVV